MAPGQVLGLARVDDELGDASGESVGSGRVCHVAEGGPCLKQCPSGGVGGGVASGMDHASGVADDDGPNHCVGIDRGMDPGDHSAGVGA